jgi:hypothetical protein
MAIASLWPVPKSENSLLHHPIALPSRVRFLPSANIKVLWTRLTARWFQEMEKRISEYDTCVCEGRPQQLQAVALDQIHAAEALDEKVGRAGLEAGQGLGASVCMQSLLVRTRDERRQCSSLKSLLKLMLRGVLTVQHQPA